MSKKKKTNSNKKGKNQPILIRKPRLDSTRAAMWRRLLVLSLAIILVCIVLLVILEEK